ncbi:proepiregulin-like [Gastrophryne carolinensis]
MVEVEVASTEGPDEETGGGGFHLIQMVACTTTVIPLCNPEDPAENCTTAIVKTTGSPHVSTIRIAKCAQKMRSYCMHGQCLYLIEQDEHYCRCENGYMGIRCSHSDLSTQPASDEYLALTIFLTSLLVVVVVFAAFFAFKWYKLRKSSQSNEIYKEVSAHNV